MLDAAREATEFASGRAREELGRADAGRLYGEAVAMASEETGSHESTWGQARLLLRHLGASDDDADPVGAAFAHLSA